MLLNEYFIQHAETDEERLLHIASFLDHVRTTIYRQTMFAEFEMIMHDKEQNGDALTPKVLGDTYYELNKLYYGDGVVSDDLIRYEWSRIPHFYSPFYVYKYATGLCAAIAIATDILDGKKGAKENYLEFLKSGSSDYPLNILKKCGIDMTSSEPIIKSVRLFEKRLNEAKEIIEKVK
jgi:oligoendopeptidase F